jgi:hypothetical protein
MLAGLKKGGLERLHQTSPSPGPGRPLTAARKAVVLDATSDIGDIDARLVQLQAFLEAAKSGAPLPELL